jgi:hypothetical protein
MQPTTPTSRTQYKLSAFGIVLFAALAVIGAMVIPVKGGHDATVVHLRTAGALAVTITTLGGAAMLLGGLKGFKASFRLAYIMLAAGLILFGIALLQLPVIGLFDLWASWWANSGALIIPFVFATALVYAGVRQFARLLNIGGILTSFPFVIFVALAVAVAGFFLGHNFARYKDVAGTDTYIATVAWSVSYCTCAVLLMRHIVRHIGASYRNAMRWMLAALAALTLSGWHEAGTTFLQGNDDFYVSHGLSFLPFVISGLVLLRAGYSFCLLSSDATVPEYEVKHLAGEASDADYTNSISYVAGLASRAPDIDPILDGMRLVTSSHKPGEQFTEADKTRLLGVYLRLEDYLMRSDPLRTYTQEELRSKLQPAFRATLERPAAVTAATPALPQAGSAPKA